MRYGHLYYSSKLADNFSWRGGENVYYVPLHLNFDNHEGYHAEQVVHPSAFCHHQIAQSIISYMNYFFQNAGSVLVTSASGSNPDADIHSKLVDEVTEGNENLNN